jgi:hypothetical protein
MDTDSTGQGGWYTADCGRIEYRLPVRYQDLAHIGQGAFGAVM